MPVGTPLGGGPGGGGGCPRGTVTPVTAVFVLACGGIGIGIGGALGVCGGGPCGGGGGVDKFALISGAAVFVERTLG